MRLQGKTVMSALVCVAFWCSTASALHSGLAVSEEFLRDYRAAYAVASSWLGSGFGIQMGSRFSW